MFRLPLSARRACQRGVTRPALVVVSLLLALAATFIFAWWQRVHRDAPAPPPVASATSATVAYAVGPSRVDADVLLRAARAAVAAQHLLAPAGDNAFERYLALRDRPSSRAAAEDALRELFPYAADQVGATIRDGQSDEARRQLALLSEADPANYTLTLLRNQLAAEEAQLAAARAAAPAPDASAPPRRVPAPPSLVDAGAPPVGPSATLASAPGPAPMPPGQAPASPKPEAGVTATTIPVPRVTTPVLVRRVEPYYPQAARSARREGWVEVAFTVMSDGHVDAVHVLQAEPGNVFDLAATTAVRRWVFKPATRNGQPIAMDLRQRLDFRL